ncbi:MAG TPA: anaerobic ribonucleoside-triphosphate reductase activating protein [Candidatus Desulfaltia sp.]|nr:anaerobic ribonucleoside-triphosphate reductase activating protein [Candidatus Desulfaltia sp.]
MVEIKGLEKFAPLDFPGFISATVFLGGCNFRCPFCHNADLVLRPEALDTIPLDYFIAFLESRRDWLEAVCVSGGEPLIWEDLEVLLRVIKDRNMLVKLDTNGSRPDRLADLIGAQLVDHIAMDVKSPLHKYKQITRSEVSEDDIARSIEIVRKCELPYTFRTTVVPGLVGEKDLLEIAQMLHRAKRFQIQQFSNRNTLDKIFAQVDPYPEETISRIAELVKPYFDEVRVEGV